MSAAFFLSIEFQQTGHYVFCLYRTALDRPNGLPGYSEFMRDTQEVQRGVVVGQSGWGAVLEANQQSYAEEFVARGEFVSLYPAAETPAEYVDSVYAHAGLTPPQAERQAAIDEFGGAATSGDAAARARALRRIGQDPAVTQREMNPSFVAMEYFGYLRRDPNAAPDSDYAGYNFWLQKLNSFGGDYKQAEMVKAFIESTEYRNRFGL
jgi:hypothetical protein